MLLMLDNYDSFTHNLVRYFAELGQSVVVKRNDQITIPEIRSLQPGYIVLSPGPCTPNESGICLSAIEAFAGDIPMLGVCLGHQAIGQVLGARVVRASAPVHGKTTEIVHRNSQLFAGLPQQFIATRYHSLVLEEESLPDELNVTGWNLAEGQKQHVMAIEHRDMPLMGVQFHPESVMTQHGHAILENFLQLSDDYQAPLGRCTELSD